MNFLINLRRKLPTSSLLLATSKFVVFGSWIPLATVCWDAGYSYGAKSAGNRAEGNATKASDGQRLEFPNKDDTVRTLRPGIATFLPTSKAILSLPERSRKLLSRVYNSNAKDRSNRFGSLESGQYLPLVGSSGDRIWRGLLQEDNDLLLLSGEESKIYYGKEISSKTRQGSARQLELRLVRPINLNTVRPAADQRGEPSALEVERTRKALHYQFLKDGPVRFTGIAPWPRAWSKDIVGRTGGAGKLYALAGSMQGFELTILQCPNPSEGTLSGSKLSGLMLSESKLSGSVPPEPLSEPCNVVRQCFLENSPSQLFRSISGIAISPKRRLIILGDSQGHRLLFVRYHSCFHMPVVRTVALPSELKSLTNIAIDHEDNLWVSTAKADDYHNASLFRWSNW